MPSLQTRGLAVLLPAAVLLAVFFGREVESQRRGYGYQSCPSGCVCLIATVRCTHRRLESFPHIPRDTRTLDLRFNKIATIPPNTFRGLRKINTMLLNNNLLKSIDQDAFKGLVQLKYLYLYKNDIASIHKHGFRGLDSLEHLYLYDNKLETIHPMTFQNVPKLQRLFLYGNQLTTLPSVLFNNLNHLRHIRVDSNPLKCDCHLSWFARYLRSSRGRGIHASATCFAPQSLAGQAIASLREENFVCPEGSHSEPIIIVNPDDAEARQRYSVRLLCRASGNPQPRISWTHNGLAVDPNSRVRLLSDGTLLIQAPRESDQGTYVCVARNSAGLVRSESAEVTYVGLNGPPVFRVTPSDTQVLVNEHVTFHCRAVGSPEPVTRWYRNGKRLPIVPNYIIMPQTLHIREASLEDNGTFTCVVANSEGKVNSSAELLVQSSPSFTTPPSDKTSIQGRSATIDCHVEGNPPPKITWLKDRSALNRDQRYLVMSSGSLLIRALSAGDEGTYTCRAVSPTGIIAADAFLTVIVPPHFTVRPQNQRVRQGTTVDFQCQVSGRPQPHIVWTVNGRAVPDDPRYNLLPSGTLRLLLAQPDDAGTFRCEGANSVGAQHAQVSLTVIPHTPLGFARSPTDQEVKSGTDVHITCSATGGGDRGTEIYWLKDGVRLVTTSGRYFITAAPSSVLTIFRAGRDDSGRYECRAQSGIDMITASMTLNVVIESSVNDIVDSLSGILPPDCLRHGCTGELTEEEFHRDDLGRVFEHFIDPHLHRGKRQSGDSPNLVSLAEFEETVDIANRLVNRGINDTVAHYNDGRNRKTAGDLLNLMRFPSSQAGVDLTKAAEVFDVSLRMIECCVKRGMQLKKFALPKKIPEVDVSTSHSRARLSAAEPSISPDFDVGPVIGTEVVELVANLSGCSGHQAVPDCSANICFHRKYRTADGTCNNLHFPLWGASLTPFHRLLQPIYENGFNAPVAWHPERRYNNHSLPSPRSVSVGVLMSAGSRPPRHDPDFTHMVMQWGQFVDHDLDFTTMAPSIQRFSDGQACKDSCEREGPCFPIGIDGDDPRHGRFHHHQPASSPLRRGGHRHALSCMEFTRSSAVCGSGITSVFFSAISRREQINQITSYLDGSNIYGSTENDTRNLRQFSNEFGLLKEGQPLERGHKPLLPYNIYSDLNSDRNFIRPVAPIECRRGDGESAQQRSVPCFLAGDLRANEQVSLTAMHTMWMREHNRIARYLRQANEHWDGDTIFHETRKIVGAQMQHITYTQWLPKLLGPFMDNIGPYRSYDPNMPASIVNVFATAAYRFGHTMINPIMFRLNESWHEASNGNLMLHEAFFAPFRIVHEGGIDPLVRGLIAKPMKARDSDSNMNSELIERLFAMAEEVALDLGALNIQRGRDHGLPFYSDWRQFCNLSRADTFDDLANEIKNPEVRAKLEELYKVTTNIDPFVGMIVEDIVPGSRLGPTLGCLLSEQFKRTRDGDRFWYENPAIFSPVQVGAIKQASLARIICDNTDSISHVPRDVFLNQPTSDFVSCDEIPSIDLTAWVDCCRDCGDQGSFETLSSHVRSRARSKRSASDVSFPEHRDFQSDVTKNSTSWSRDSADTESFTFDKQEKNEHITFEKNLKPIPGSKRQQDEAFDKLTALVEKLEKRVGQLQAEVQRLEGKLDADGTD